MRKELDEALCRDFPLTFADRHADMRTTCMCWGFDVEDGWEPLVRRIAEFMEKVIHSLPEQVKGEFKASQVKEKFGGLRFYTTLSHEAVDKVIRVAEEESYKTCEVCGRPGELRKGGWWRTLCDEHEAARHKTEE